MKDPNRNETIRASKPENLSGVEIVRADHSARLWSWHHETYTICTTDPGPGSSEWFYRGKHRRSLPGEMMGMEPGELHVTQRVAQPASFWVLVIQPDVVEHGARELSPIFHKPHIIRSTISDGFLCQSFTQLHKVLDGQATPLECQSWFASCLQLFLERCSEDPPPEVHESGGKRAVRRAVEVIRDCLDENVSLDRLAEASGMSKYHLLRTFARKMGVPPHEYQTLARISKSRTLLRRRVPLAHIAAEVGFFDQSHFTRHFKRVMGVTPGQYVKP